VNGKCYGKGAVRDGSRAKHRLAVLRDRACENTAGGKPSTQNRVGSNRFRNRNLENLTNYG
jgi:hypothetical protein